MLRQWSYREHYHPNMTAHDRQHLEVHIGKESWPLWSVLQLMCFETIASTGYALRPCATLIRQR